MSRLCQDRVYEWYATEAWVNGRGFLTAATVPAPNLDGYATETWVNGRGFLTAATVPAPNLDGYATETWVNGRGFLTAAPSVNWNTVLQKPDWVNSAQDEVLLANFGGNIDASRVNNLPSGGNAEWSALTNRPEWTNHFAWENIGQYLINPEQTNFDIVAANSITPSAHKTYNLGQQGRRWAYVYADEVRSRGIGFFDTDPFQSTYFTGSYNELRDKPDIPAPPVLPDLSILDQLIYTPATFGGDISVRGNRITNAAGPVDNLDVTNKAWVETAIYVAESNLYFTLSDEIEEAVGQISVPSRTSQLTNDSGFVSATSPLGAWFRDYGSRSPVRVSVGGGSTLVIECFVSLPFQTGSQPIFHKVDVSYRYVNRGDISRIKQVFTTLGLSSTRSDDALYVGNTFISSSGTPVSNASLGFSVIADVEYAGSRAEYVLKSSAITNLTTSITDYVF